MAGIKHDQDKLRYDLVPLDALEEVIKVLGYGANKKGERNWEEGIEYSRLYAATQRHLSQWFQFRVERDFESDLPHLAHAACNLLFLLAYEVRGRVVEGIDNRPSTYLPYSTDWAYYLDQASRLLNARADLEKEANQRSHDRWLLEQAKKICVPATPTSEPGEERVGEWDEWTSEMMAEPLQSLETLEQSQSPLDSHSSCESSDAPPD